MKTDEFAFFNQQLSAMLRDGIPLEGALRRLCQEMRRGTLRAELESLEADLAKGTPLTDALATRQLPELYKRMLLVGVKSGDLPAVLTLLADHYQRQHSIWTRLKGLMVYPMIVLISAFVLSCFLSLLLGTMIPNMTLFLGDWFRTPNILIGLWLSPVLLGLAVVAMCVGVSVASVRRALRWRLPAFKEASLAQVASVMALLLKSGLPLDDALALVEQLEKGTRAEIELTLWRQRLAAGQGKFSEMATAGRTFPPLFIWMVAHGGEDLATGFQHTAEIYQARATYRIELLLYSALPCSVLALGMMIVTQIQPVLAVLAMFMKSLGDVGGGE
jgi:type II secretory pathway component PulF